MLERFQRDSYLLRRKVFKLFGGAFHIYGDDDELLFYSKQKAFKLKEDIRLYSDESLSDEVLTILAQSAIDFAAVYDVVDTVNDTLVGSIKREGWRSIARDEWRIFDADGNEVGIIIEDSGALAFVRRFVSNLIPQSFIVDIAENEVCQYKQQFNPFVYKLRLQFGEDANAFDRIMSIAGSVLIAAIEGRQN